MSQIKHIFNNIFSLIFVSLAVACAVAGCQDEIIYSPAEIPDAEVDVEAEVIFRPLVKTEIETRASDAPEGDKYEGINSLIVFFFDKNGNRVDEYTGEITNFAHVENESTTLQRVKFKKRIQAGEYYVFAVTNITTDQKSGLLGVSNMTELRKFNLNWDDAIEKDIEMFGVFRLEGADTAPESVMNNGFEQNELIAITPTQNKIHSWVRRAVSKVTIDFDGSALKENVTVYIKNAVLKDVPSGALLGAESKVSETDFECRQSDYVLSYGQGDAYANWPSLTKSTKLDPPASWEGKGFHDDAAMSLPCYENMQGKFEDEPNKKHQDKNKDGIIDSIDKDGVTFGTYLEVEGYYVSDRLEYKSQGKIIYRFMLGQNADNDFNFMRNHHYKITMKFKDYGSDIDWHIVYAERYLDATNPEDVNYKGQFFTPDPNWVADYNGGVPNAGHDFDNQNTIKLTSFETDGKNISWISPSSISYTYYTHDDVSDSWIKGNTFSEEENESKGWLKNTKVDVIDEGSKQYTYVASMATPTNSKVNELFPTTTKGSSGTPYNLSSATGSMDVENTANSYMVGEAGWYCFPLVYGNGYTDKTVNSSAYSPTHFINHLGQHITAPYIKDNIGDAKMASSNISVKLIWQDVNGLVNPSEISYDPNLFGGKGGIKFHISSIKEGNAVIALIDNSAGEDEYVNINREADGNGYGTSGSTKAIWSWHIWATRFGFDFEKNIQVLSHDETAYDFMPVHLGWCAGDKPVIYYPRRKCDITFKVGDEEIVRTVEQYPHFVLPRGDHPYYQWGRKDPFVAASTTVAGGNKPRWDHNGKEYPAWTQYNPPRLYNEPDYEYLKDNRKNTKDCIDVLIKNPDKWHNAKRLPEDLNDIEHKNGFYSANQTYPDLWSINAQKTIYDPCPPGYMVGSDDIYSGFTTSGNNIWTGKYWYDVLETNMHEYDYGGGTINANVIEFYTDTRKLQSITFPISGYRDYDNKATITDYPAGTYNGVGFVWTNRAKTESHSHQRPSGGYVYPGAETCCYHLKVLRSDLNGGDWKERGALIGPREDFYSTDGFAVRPVKIKKQEETVKKVRIND